MSEQPNPIPKIPDARVDLGSRPLSSWRTRARAGMITTTAGFLLFLIGARPGIFGLDRSPVIGFVQVSVFLLGLALICLGGVATLRATWQDHSLSIPAEIGIRLVATGYVISFFAGMADIFGMGSHPLPGYPFFGPWQARGVEIGELIIGIGLVMMLPYDVGKLKEAG